MQINLPQPCNENWQKMSLDEKGRHCQVCDKVVHDFTSYSDAELVAFFEREQGVCGRFKPTQIGRNLHDRSSHKHKWAFAACSLIMLTHAELQAQNAVVATKDSVAAVNVFTQEQKFNVVRVTIQQTDTQADRITRLRMMFGDFSIDSDLDSNNSLSISIPTTSVGSLVKFELYNQLGDTIVLLEPRIGLGNLNFSKVNGRWTIFTFLILPENPIIPPFTIGFPMPINLLRYPWVTNIEKRDTIHLLGDTIAITSPDTLQNDSTTKLVIKNVKASARASSNKGLSKVWWASIIGGIGLALGWFWRRNKKK